MRGAACGQGGREDEDGRYCNAATDSISPAYATTCCSFCGCGCRAGHLCGCLCRLVAINIAPVQGTQARPDTRPLPRLPLATRALSRRSTLRPCRRSTSSGMGHTNHSVRDADAKRLTFVSLTYGCLGSRTLGNHGATSSRATSRPSRLRRTRARLPSRRSVVSAGRSVHARPSVRRWSPVAVCNRSLSWLCAIGGAAQIFLGLLPDDSMSTWAEQLHSSRDQYATLRKRYVLDVQDKLQAENDLMLNNPLSQAEDVGSPPGRFVAGQGSCADHRVPQVLCILAATTESLETLL